MKKFIVASGISAFLAAFSLTADAGTAYVFNASGMWTCPAGVTNVQVECWGGGGAGGAAKATSGSGLAGGGGGGGGAYSITNIPVTAGNMYSVTVGGGGLSSGGSSASGSPSSFTGDSSATITANGGSAGVSEAANGFGTGGAGGATNAAGISFAGGTGATAVTGTGGGGGGSSAGQASAGANGATVNGGTGPAGGGTGGAGSSSSADGGAGFFPGGGGSGAYSKSTTQRNGGAGGGGQVVITAVNSPFAFNPGDLVVLVPSDSGANNTTLTMLDINSSTPSQSFAYGVYIDGTNSSGLRFSGSAGTSGYLAVTGDGSLLTFTGANTTVTTNAVNAIAARGVGTLNAAAGYTLQTTYTATISPTTQPRGASTIDDVNWVIGDQGGVYTNLSTNPAPAGNFKAAKSFGGTNYVLTDTTNYSVVMAYANGTTNSLPGVPGDANATDFYFVSSGLSGTNYDILYVIDNTSATAGTIYKYVLSSGTWSLQGTYPTGVGGWGLCAQVSGGVVNLFFTTGSATTSNSVVLITDSATPLNTTFSGGTETTLYTAAAGQLLKGITVAPVPEAPIVVSSAASSIATTSVTLNGSVTYDGGGALTDYGFYWSTNSPVTTGSTKAQVGTSDHSGAYTGNLTGLGVNTRYFYRAYADNSAGNTLASLEASFWTLANTPTAPAVGSPTTNSLAVTIGSGDGNPANTVYAIKETTTGDYVQIGGTLGVSPIFTNASIWGTVTVTGLNPSTTYTFEVEAQNGAGTNTSFGPSVNGTTATPPSPTITVTPEVLNFPPTLAGTSSASQSYSVSGVHLNGNIVITAPANFQISTNSGSGFGTTVTLVPTSQTVPTNTIYVQFNPTSQTLYSNTISDNSTGANNPTVTVIGIGATGPSVSTQAANPTNTTSATLNGNVTTTNGAPITDRGFYLSTGTPVTTSGTKIDQGGTTTGSYSAVATNLSPNALYYFDAYASNTVGFTLDNSVVSFYTLANTPTAPTVATASTTTVTVAISSGDGNPAATTYAIEETNSGNYVQSGGALGGSPVFQTASAWGIQTVTSLTFGTPYAFRAMAQNSANVPTAFGPAATVFTANLPFTPGNLAVLSANVASANNTAFTIQEINPVTASLIQTIPINGTTGSNALRTSGSATSAPKLANTSDGTLLVIAAFNSTNSSGTANTILPRAVATLDASNDFVVQTTYTGVSGNQVRNATSADNKTWYVADAGGLYTNNETTPQNGASIPLVKSFGGTVYVLQSAKNTTPVSVVSPDGTTFTALPGLTSRDSAAVDFYMVCSGNNGIAYDVLYVLDETSASLGAINKYSLVNGSWVTNGSAFTTGFGGCGLAAAMSGNQAANLYVTTGVGSNADNQLVLLADSAGWNNPINVTTSNVLYTAVGTATMKAVAFAPVNPLIVTNTADTGAGTLRSAIASAYSGATIEFAANLSGSTISLASTLTINTNLTIDGSSLASSIKISGQNSVQPFNIAAGNTVLLTALTITNGSASQGGAVSNNGTLTVHRSTLAGNSASGAGGAIDNESVLTVSESTLTANNAYALLNDGTMYITQSTVVSNIAGGALNSASGTLNVFNSILAGNGTGADITNANMGTFNGSNIVLNLADPGTGMSGNTPLVVAPQLSALGNNGGPTLTMLPATNSPAVNAGDNSTLNIFTVDQRGLPRLSGLNVDIGAVEVQGFSESPLITGPTMNTNGFQFIFTGRRNGSYTVLASTNILSPIGAWQNLGAATENPVGSGLFQFTNSQPTNVNQFYLLRSP